MGSGGMDMSSSLLLDTTSRHREERSSLRRSRSRASRPSIHNLHLALALDQQVVQELDVVIEQADASLAHVLADRCRIDRAVDAVAFLADAFAVDTLERDPAFAERVGRVVGGDHTFAAG